MRRMVRPAQTSPAVNWRPWKRVLINAFILWHLYIFVIWGLPGSRFRQAMIQPVNKYVLYAGLWHSWDMFSPDPLAVNFHLQAFITFRDGAMAVWNFPQMEKLGLFERMQKERYRKLVERVRQDAYQMVWDDAARHVARLHRNATNPPAEVMLVRNWSPIPKPAKNEKGEGLADHQPMPEKFEFTQSYRFKVYKVQPGDL